MKVALVVGIIGKIASGKGEASRFLEQEYGAQTFKFSDILKEKLIQDGKPVTRENLQALGNKLRAEEGDDVLVKKLKEKIQASSAQLAVVDGVRYPAEADMVRGFENNLIIYVTAPDEVRYQRVLSRGTRGEAEITFEEFKKHELDQTEQQIDSVGAGANYTIENTGTVEELRSQVKEIMSKFI